MGVPARPNSLPLSTSFMRSSVFTGGFPQAPATLYSTMRLLITGLVSVRPYLCVCVCVFVCVRGCVRVCVCVCV